MGYTIKNLGRNPNRNYIYGFKYGKRPRLLEGVLSGDLYKIVDSILERDEDEKFTVQDIIEDTGLSEELVNKVLTQFSYLQFLRIKKDKSISLYSKLVFATEKKYGMRPQQKWRSLIHQKDSPIKINSDEEIILMGLFRLSQYRGSVEGFTHYFEATIEEMRMWLELDFYTIKNYILHLQELGLIKFYSGKDRGYRKKRVGRRKVWACKESVVRLLVNSYKLTRRLTTSMGLLFRNYTRYFDSFTRGLNQLTEEQREQCGITWRDKRQGWKSLEKNLYGAPYREYDEDDLPTGRWICKGRAYSMENAYVLWKTHLESMKSFYEIHKNRMTKLVRSIYLRFMTPPKEGFEIFNEWNARFVRG